MTERTHFVYRVFDDRGLLLYVGCTKDLDRRRKQHKYDSAAWFPYMSRVRLEGPFGYDAGFAREAEVIESEYPFFNALSAQRSVLVQRSALERRLHRELRVAKPHLYTRGAEPMMRAFEDECDRIQEEVDATFPKYDTAWRLQTYLQARIVRKVVAA